MAGVVAHRRWQHIGFPVDRHIDFATRLDRQVKLGGRFAFCAILEQGTMNVAFVHVKHRLIAHPLRPLAMGRHNRIRCIAACCRRSVCIRDDSFQNGLL